MVAMVSKLQKTSLGILGLFSSSLYKLSMQISMVSSSGMLVNKESTSRLGIYKLGSYLQISSAKWNESVTVYSFGVKNGSRNFANLLVGIPVAVKIRQKGGSSILASLYTFPNPYKMPGVDPTSLMFFDLEWLKYSRF